MRKLMLFALLATMFAACSKNDMQDVAASSQLPEVIYAGIDADASRVQLNAEQKTVWTKGDQIFVLDILGNAFLYNYTGEGGESVGEFKIAGQVGQTNITYNKPYAFYAPGLSLGTLEGGIPAGIMEIGAVQNYAPNSYDPTFVNQMVAVEGTMPMEFSFKNVLGYLKVSLTGSQAVKSIKLSNTTYPLAGKYYVSVEDAASFQWYQNLLGGVTLNCGDGVQLSSTPTDFYFVMGPGNHPEGITMTVEFTDGTTWSKTNTTGFTIERNTIQSLSVMNVAGGSSEPEPEPEPELAEIEITSLTAASIMTPAMHGIAGVYWLTLSDAVSYSCSVSLMFIDKQSGGSYMANGFYPLNSDATFDPTMGGTSADDMVLLSNPGYTAVYGEFNGEELELFPVAGQDPESFGAQVQTLMPNENNNLVQFFFQCKEDADPAVTKASHIVMGSYMGAFEGYQAGGAVATTERELDYKNFLMMPTENEVTLEFADANSTFKLYVKCDGGVLCPETGKWYQYTVEQGHISKSSFYWEPLDDWWFYITEGGFRVKKESDTVYWFYMDGLKALMEEPKQLICSFTDSGAWKPTLL